jgi:hypothetical protein
MYLSGMRINQLVLQHGGIAAFISVILSLVAYLLGVEMLLGWQLSIAQVLLVIVTMVVVSRSVRADEGGFINYGRLLGHIMLATVCVVFGSVFFNFMLYNVIAPDLVDVVLDISSERVREMMLSFGVEGELLEESMRDTESRIRDSYTLIGSVKGIIFGSVFWVFPALIVAAIFKNSSPNPFQ